MADEEETLLPYDIVELVTSDDMNGNFAYITRIPIESDATKTHKLWFPGNEDEIVEPRELILPRSSLKFKSRPDDSSIVNILDAVKDNYIIGIPSEDFISEDSLGGKRHILKIIRVDDNSIYVTNKNDLTETVLSIPFDDRGIGENSPYVFLLPTKEGPYEPDTSEIADEELTPINEL